MTTAGAGLTLARRLGAGGEAEVFEVEGRPSLAYKRFRVPSPRRAEKLRVMLEHPPRDAEAGGHVAIAWPRELVTARDGTVEGFLMPRIDLSRTVPLFQVYNPASRLQIAPAFTWRYLLRTARNLAAIVDSLHAAGYVIGDINESNFLVNRRALAVLVDCDSMQVRDPATGVVHRGGVGKPEFTAPELHGLDLSTVDRTPESDAFALAILVFQLLHEGVHPFAGIWKGGGEPPDVAERMRRGLFPYRRGAGVAPPPRALGPDVLPPELRRLVRRTFTTGVRRPAARPSAGQWAAALERADATLRVCGRSPHHVFGGHRRRCPWCERFDAGLPDPFPGPSGRSTLARRPPPVARRVRAATAVRLSSAGRRLTTVAAATAGRAVGRLRAPLGWRVPLSLLAAMCGALLPPLAIAAYVVRAAYAPVRHRTPVPWFRLGTEGAAVLAATSAGSWLVWRGPPPVDVAAATSASLLAVRTVPPSVLRWGTGRLAPVSGMTTTRAVVCWVAVGLAAVALATTGPRWWPFG